MKQGLVKINYVCRLITVFKISSYTLWLHCVIGECHPKPLVNNPTDSVDKTLTVQYSQANVEDDA